MPLILVVDDDPDIREIMVLHLEGAGYRVILARNGREALEHVQQETPDAILLDVMMPEVDGWKVLRDMKSVMGEELSLVPIFMLTGLADIENRVRGGVEGAVQYIAKPFDPADVLQTLAVVLDPNTPSERELRLEVQKQSLEALARLEGGEDPSSVLQSGPVNRVRLTQLEHEPSDHVPAPRLRQIRERLSTLTDKQRDLLEELSTGKTVITVSDELHTSRSNVYSSLKRIGRKLGVENTNELLGLLRQGALFERP